jgi:histidinol-phosphatase (PHP family)
MSPRTALPQPVLFDSHLHTPLCRHATGEPEEYVRRGLARGLRGVTFTCHSPMPGGWFEAVRMRPEELAEYVRRVESARHALEGEIEVRLGMESDFFPGMEWWLEELHRQADFHYILGSVHFFGPEYLARFGTWNNDLFVATYFNHLAQAAESGLFDCLAHPDLIKNHRPEHWHLPRYRGVIARALDRIAATGVALELNTSGTTKAYAEMNPGLDFLRLMKERDIPVVLGSDSHHPQRVADQFEAALLALVDAGYRRVSQFDRRQREEVDIATALASLRPAARPVARRVADLAV